MKSGGRREEFGLGFYCSVTEAMPPAMSTLIPRDKKGS